MNETGSKGKDFRLVEIRNIRNKLQTEVYKRDCSRRKYKRANAAAHAINIGGCVVGSAAVAGAITGLSTGVGIIVAVPLGGIALGSTIVGLIGSSVQKFFYKKIQKHDRLLMLAEVKLSTINVLISKALNDDSISDEEFNSIAREMADYHVKKRAIQTKVRTEVGEEIPKLVRR